MAYIVPEEDPLTPAITDGLDDILIFRRITFLVQSLSLFRSRNDSRDNASSQDLRLFDAQHSMVNHQAVQFCQYYPQDPLVVDQEHTPQVIDAAHRDVAKDIKRQRSEFVLVQQQSHLIY